MAFSFWLAWKVTTRRALIGISSPVFGLRPGRCGLSRSWKLPNPESFTLSPRSSAPRISSKKASTMSLASRLFRPTFSNSRSASSAFVNVIARSPEPFFPFNSGGLRRIFDLAGLPAHRGQHLPPHPKGSFSILHNYPERKAFSPGRQTFAAIQAKQPHSPHDGWFFGLDGVENRLCRGVGVEKQGHIPHHGGVLGRHLRAGKRDRLQGLRLHLEEHWRLWQLVLLLPLRVQLADPSRRRATDKNARRTAGVKSRMRCRLETHRERRYEILEIRLHVEEVDAARRSVPLLIQHGAIGGGADAHGLAHPGDRKRTVLRRRIAQVHATDLEDADARHFARLVVADVRDEGTHERGAHHGLVAGDRIQQPDGIRFTREIGL